jgi:hypothetical protein
VWWEVLSYFENEPPGSAWRAVFYGTLRPDFTILARYGDLDTADALDGGWAPRGDAEVVVEIIEEQSDLALRVPYPVTNQGPLVLDYLKVSSRTELPVTPPAN